MPSPIIDSPLTLSKNVPSLRTMRSGRDHVVDMASAKIGGAGGDGAQTKEASHLRVRLIPGWITFIDRGVLEREMYPFRSRASDER